MALPLLLLLCAAPVSFARTKMIHEFMTPDEVMGVFHTTHEAIPEYELVPVLHSKQKRDTDSTSEVHLSVFKENLKLYLKPTEGILASHNTPLWTVRSDPRAPEGMRYKQIPNAMKSLGVMMQDYDNGAALLATLNTDNTTLFDGVLPSDLVIRSLPPRVLSEVMYGNDGLYAYHPKHNQTANETMVYSCHHVIYKKPPLKGRLYQDVDMSITHPEVFESTKQKRSLPDVIYPKVLVVIDYNEYLLLGRNIEQAKRYLISFWNAVDLRYRLLTTPKIRFNVAGIVIALDTDAIPYLARSHVDVAMVDADRALRSMGDYFYREDRFAQGFYDMVITMTQLDLCNMIYDNICDSSTLGYAYVAGACDRNDTKRSSEAVGMVEDNGGFSGIIPTAHEIGHLLGARHDGHPQAAKDCPPFEGFIMTSGLLLQEKGFEWSNCSINSFHKFLNEKRARCLYTKPATGPQVPRFLPGKLMSLDAQCKKVYGTPACNKDATVCTRLNCQVPGSDGLCKATAPAAEGSPCGKGLYCLNGKCVLEGTLNKKQETKTDFSPSLNFEPREIRPYFNLR
ncbi:hypothetical protein KM043_004909 [Ampulex compressa]|nr:hypothetical protein KM043_004909 [Ampulex compressa]